MVLRTERGLYQIYLLGDVSEHLRNRLTQTLSELVDVFGFKIGGEVTVGNAASVSNMDTKAACAALYVAGSAFSEDDTNAIQDLLRHNVPIIPYLSTQQAWEDVLPTSLKSLNGMRQRQGDDRLEELSSAILECVGLLRRQRRVFISYRRTESRDAAVQIHAQLLVRGFDVFLDTHSVRVGDPFQDVLWHRLVDSDVVVMLDTKGFSESCWTRRELGTASYCGVSILRIKWPQSSQNRSYEQYETIPLAADSLTNRGSLKSAILPKIALAVESIRSRAIAARYRAICGQIEIEVQKIGAVVKGIGANRAIAIELPNTGAIYVYPVVGVPTAEVINEIASNVDRAREEARSIIAFDHLGVRQSWLSHLEWLNQRLSAPKTHKARELGLYLVQQD